MRKIINAVKRTLKSESGNMQSLTWVLGATVVTVLVIVGLMTLMPTTTSGFFSAAADWIRRSFGF